jgi:DNA anti-recombination protein RmuC
MERRLRAVEELPLESTAKILELPDDDLQEVND